MKKSFHIKNIDCANCALKLEDAFKKLNGVEKVTVDFVREMVHFTSKKEYTSDDFENIARTIEPNVRIYKRDTHEKDQSSQQELIINSVGVFILLVVLAMQWVFRIDSPTLKLTLYILSYLMIGGKVLYKAFRNMLHRQFFDEHFLMTLATIGAFLIGEYIEGIGVMLFYRIGEYLQDRAVNSSKKSIKKLLDIKPVIAHLIQEDSIIDVKPETLLLHQKIKIYPGEKVPVDGIIIDGFSSVDQSKLTGESLPVDVSKDDVLLSGSMNLQGVLTMKVTEIYENSTVAKIIEFAEHHVHKKAKAEQFITKFAKVYTPVVVMLALILAFVVPLCDALFFSQETYQALLNVYVRRALIFLVISCPCALVLSIPLSFFSGIGASSRQGVLIKSGSDLEAFSTLNYVIFDKTGTLTKGTFEVVDIVSDQKDLCLSYAAHAEIHSNHPIAKSIVSAYQQPLVTSRVTHVSEIFGQGVICHYEGEELYVGNEKLMDAKSINYPKHSNGRTIIYVAYKKIYIGAIILSDTLKETSKETIDQLKQQHVEVICVTGDHEEPTKHMLSSLGITYYANCLPQHKVQIIETYLNKGKTAFIGDGVNDTPVLMAADLGVSMGKIGSDAAIEASDAVIMNDQPIKLLETIQLSKKTMKIVKQNIVFAIGIKLLFLLLGALGFASMWYAIFADVGVSLLAVLNTMRILNVRASTDKVF